MPEYIATFSIVVEARTPKAAARHACEEVFLHIADSLDKVQRCNREGEPTGEPIPAEHLL